MNPHYTTSWAAILLGAVLSCAACTPTTYPPTENTDLDVCVRNPACTDKLALGHRGTGSFNLWAPENTIAALEIAWEMGADSIEIDVRETSDGVLVLMHDSTVDRTTNGTGRVDEMTLAEIKALTTFSINPAVPAQTVPTFLEALQCLHGKTLVDVDIKDATMSTLVADIVAADMLDAAYLLIGSVGEGQAARAAHPDVALMPKVHSAEDVYAFEAALSPIVFFEPDVEDVDLALREAVCSTGARLHLDALGFYDILGELGFDIMLGLGADIIQTDRLSVLVPYLREL